MTANQIAYQVFLENRRSNLAREGETARSNVSREMETHRYNVEYIDELRRQHRNSEGISRAMAMENARHNRAVEEANIMDIRGRIRHNIAQDAETRRANEEIRRANKRREELREREVINSLDLQRREVARKEKLDADNLRFKYDQLYDESEHRNRSEYLGITNTLLKAASPLRSLLTGLF